MKNIIKKSITTVLILAMALTLVIPVETQAAGKVRLNRTKATLTMTDTKAKPAVQLKVKGTSKKVTWTTSDKTVATVSRTGKVTAKKSGSVKITAKVGGKKHTCKVTVVDKRTKLSKTKVTLTITKKKTKPAVQLKVKNAAGRKVKWVSSNKKVATVSKSGKVVAKKKGVAVVRARIGKKTLKCKITVKDIRNNKPEQPKECQHVWVEKTVVEIVCECGETFPDDNARILHNRQFILQGLNGHAFSTNEQTYYECSKCHKIK